MLVTVLGCSKDPCREGTLGIHSFKGGPDQKGNLLYGRFGNRHFEQFQSEKYGLTASRAYIGLL